MSHAMQHHDVMSDTAAAVKAGAQLAALLSFDGTADAFWPLFLQRFAEALSARRVLLLSSSVGRPWQAMAQWPVKAAAEPQDADRALRLLGQAAHGQPAAAYDEREELTLAMMPTQLQGTQVLALVALGVDVEVWDEVSLVAWAGLVASIPAHFMLQIQRRQAQAATPSQAPTEAAGADQASVEQARRLHEILQLSIRLGQEQRFMALAMALCNALALRFACERVSLGWVSGHYVRLVAVSHVEHFDRKSTATRALEAAQEEALDQERALLFPAPPESRQVLRSHQIYADLVGANCLATVPLACGEQVVAVLCLERDQSTLSAAELWELGLLGESLASWLQLRQQQDRWFGLRWYESARRQVGEFFRPRRTAAKLALAGAASLLLGSALLPWDYRVDAALAVRSEDLRFVPAPFDGYLSEVHVEVGDAVKTGEVLVGLDTRDLAQEFSMAEADVVRYARDVEKALAVQQLGDMQIALAKQQQASARLELIRYKLDNAEVRAPHDGVVIEGELRKNLGAPLRKGDLLLKLAKTSETYLELEIDQSDVQNVAVGSRAEFSLVGRPDQRWRIELSRIEPAAVQRDGKTVFLARAQLLDAETGDWRPGMGGMAKIEAGQRALIWVLTHRTVRFLREFFWI